MYTMHVQIITYCYRWLSENIFVPVFLVIYGIENDCVILFISLTKVECGLIPITIAPRWGFFTFKTAFLHSLHAGLWGLNVMYEYMYCWEDYLVIIPLRPFFFGNKMTLSWLSYLLFIIDFIWNWNINYISPQHIFS